MLEGVREFAFMDQVFPRITAVALGGAFDRSPFSFTPEVTYPSIVSRVPDGQTWADCFKPAP